MDKVGFKISFGELARFVDVEEHGHESYQHVKKVMNALGKHPIIPAFQTISVLGNNEIPDRLEKAKTFSTEGYFSSIICPGDKIEFRKEENNRRIKFVWENPDKFLKNYKFKSFVDVTFCFNEKYEKSTAPRVYSRKSSIIESKLQTFSEIIRLHKHNHLTDMFYIASHATSLIILGFVDPRNKFEDRIFRIREDHERTPFYRYIKINFNKNIEIIPGDLLYEFNGQIIGRKTVSIDFRAMKAGEELINGILRVDFIAKNSVLKFTKDL